MIENNKQQKINSPNNQKTLEVGVANGAIWYSLKSTDEVLIDTSHLALLSEDKNVLAVTGRVVFTEDTYDETWEQPWGEQRWVRNNYRELSLQTSNFTVRFRLYDEGVGFRYELAGEAELTIDREDTEFVLPTESEAWWIPALGGNHYEHLYKKTRLGDMGIAHTPLTLELPGGGFASVLEAALYDYGAMNIVFSEGSLKSAVTPLRDGVAARIQLPFTSPWRTVIFSDTAAGLGASKMMLNLNEPSKIKDTSWIRPTKFMGIWWGMFTGCYTWSSGERHGATTANALRYINAAQRLGISALLIEGWNEGWDGDWTKNGDKMNLMQPYQDFDIHMVASYAKQHGVDIVGHHETSGNISHYEWQLPEAYDYYRHLGVRYVKTGYVSPRLNTGDFHSSQVGVKHYQRTVEMTAERHMMIDIHEPVKGTGTERTWPNLMTREGVMGQEYEGGGAVTPEHATVLPFTRLLAGPLDYTPGIFNLNNSGRKVSTTLAKQLAFYVTMYSPMQMVADMPEHYDSHPAFEFIRHVPVNWEVTVPLDGIIGDYFVTARKDRHSDDWYVGGVSDEEERTITINLEFLDEHRSYQATIYKDAHDSHWDTRSELYEIEERHVTKTDSVEIYMAPGGGFAMRIAPLGQTQPRYPQQ